MGIFRRIKSRKQAFDEMKHASDVIGAFTRLGFLIAGLAYASTRLVAIANAHPGAHLGVLVLFVGLTFALLILFLMGSIMDYLSAYTRELFTVEGAQRGRAANFLFGAVKVVIGVGLLVMAIVVYFVIALQITDQLSPGDSDKFINSLAAFGSMF